MAKDKRSVIIYVDWITTFNELEDVEAGQLIKHLFRYVNDQNPEPQNRLIKLLFEPIKQSLKRDLRKYEDKRLKNIDNANKRWHNNNAIACGRIKDDAKHAVSDSDSDSDNVIDKKEKKKEADFLSKIISAFQVAYFEIFQIEYKLMSIGKERAAASKLLQEFKKIHPDAKSEEVITGLSEYFKKCCEVPDDWLQKNMSLPIIVSKFNEINNSIKNGKSKKIRSVASRSDEVNQIVNAVFDQKGLQ